MNEFIPAPEATGQPPADLARRGVLLSVPALLAAAVLPLPACTRKPLPSEAATLAHFLRLSSLLTGFDELPEEPAALYLRSLMAEPAHAGALLAIYEKAGFLSGRPPVTLEALTAAGIFDDARLRATADKLTVCWYSGLYDTPKGLAAVPITEALAWKALAYAAPPTVCLGPMGAWAEPPHP